MFLGHKYLQTYVPLAELVSKIDNEKIVSVLQAPVVAIFSSITSEESEANGL